MKKLSLAAVLLVIIVIGFQTRPTITSPERAEESIIAKPTIKDLDSIDISSRRGSTGFDLSEKVHYFDPATATTAHGKPLMWTLAPFHPSETEFQVIAEYEAALRRLNESTSEESYQSKSGRKAWSAKLKTLKEGLNEGLRGKRYDRYHYVMGSKTHYAPAWRVLNVNGIDEAMVEELRAMADSYNLAALGKTIDHRSPKENSSMPDYNTLVTIKEKTRQRIRERFGDQVLHDLITVPSLDLFNGLGDGAEHEFRDPWEDVATRERLKEHYLISFVTDNAIPEHLEPRHIVSP